MQDVQMGKVISILSVGRIERLVDDLRRWLKPIKIRYYHADLPISLLLGNPKNANACPKKKANYVQIFWRGKKILEFYGKDIRGNGHIFEDKLGDEQYTRVVEMLAKNNMYTFRSWKSKNPLLRFAMVLLGVVDLFAGLAVAQVSPVLGSTAVLFGLFLIILYVK